jgi:hypothetical protein
VLPCCNHCEDHAARLVSLCPDITNPSHHRATCAVPPLLSSCAFKLMTPSISQSPVQGEPVLDPAKPSPIRSHRCRRALLSSHRRRTSSILASSQRRAQSLPRPPAALSLVAIKLLPHLSL